MTQLSGLGEVRPRKGSDLNREIGSLVNYVRTFEFGPNTFVILVCRHGAIEGLTSKINHKRQRVLGRFKNLAIRVTDDIRLSAMVTAAEKPWRSEAYDNLVIIASGFVDHLYFEIGSTIMDLRVYRCGTDHNPGGYLYLEGFSTFHGQPIRNWEAMHHEARFWLGPGVVLNLGSHIGQLGKLSEDSASLSGFDQEKVRSNIDKMDKVKMEGTWWYEFRAPISAIVGTLTSAAKYAHAGFIKMTAEGMLVQYGFVGFALVAATAAAVSVDAVSAGTALLVAPGVAAAVYFIPWESVFCWLNSVASWLKTGIKKIWEKIKDWLATCASLMRGTLWLDGRSHGAVQFSA
ncbi:hypothetical protein J3F83DRAFT_284253 [Trichoderma novae-zelandiae]